MFTAQARLGSRCRLPQSRSQSGSRHFRITGRAIARARRLNAAHHAGGDTPWRSAWARVLLSTFRADCAALLRIREALEGVAWDDVDLKARTVRVRGTKTAAADRGLALSDELAARLARRRGEPADSCSEPPGSTPRSGVRARSATCSVGSGGCWRRRVCRGPARTRSAAPWPLGWTRAERRSPRSPNQLGHADVNTTAGYLGRRQAPTRAATVMTLSLSDTAE